MALLNVQGMQLPLIVHIENDNDVLTATMDSPNQNVTGIPVKEISFKGGKLNFKIPAMNIEYAGTADGDFQKYRRQVYANGADDGSDLVKKKIVIEAPKRPQEPKKPYPYHEEDVSYENKAAGITLAATLSLPNKQGSFPVAILISGSGPQNRDEELLGHKPFLVLADHLVRQGIAVLRFDDRGVGASTGDHSKATTADFATDVQAGINYLKTRKEINKDQIGLIGHSEGGLIAPIVSSQSDDVAFVVMLAGPGVDGIAILREQSVLIAKAEGSSQKDIDDNAVLQEKAFDIIKNNTDMESVKKVLRAMLGEAYDAYSEENKMQLGNKENFVDGQVKRLATPWMQFFLTYDPQPALEKTKCPVLAINGELDLQVPPYQNLPAIEAALKKGGNKNYTIKELPKLNHLFQTTETGAFSEYAQLEETFSPTALKVVSDWVLSVVK